jgi:hypothetical protein
MECNKLIFNIMRKLLLIFIALIITSEIYSFCGFYVAKAGANLYNKKSEVILVRDGNETTITMNNDFKGNVKDFAMVIPVPNLIARSDIKIAESSIFTFLDNYSSPRLVEYYDYNPCYNRFIEEYDDEALLEEDIEMENKQLSLITSNKYSVTVEAQYNVEEYKIVILSAKKSEGLKQWLVDNGYKIPSKAEKVLEPYIKSGLKFFVVKVDLNKYNPQKNRGFLRPIQVKVKSNKFMLPIRLGMANSNGEQDMIVYTFTKKGRVECTNYRSVEVPTNRNVPTFVKSRFGSFYKDLFAIEHQRQGRDVVAVEYAWNVSPSWSGVKCDPCVGNPPYANELLQAGVNWAGRESVFFTRLHVRYSLDKFPEDLFFQETPNKAHFQARYVVTHPAPGPFNCDEGKTYLTQLKQRRRKELSELAALTQWPVHTYYDYIANGTDKVSESEEEEDAVPLSYKPKDRTPKILFFIVLSFLLVYSFINIKKLHYS